MQQFQQRPPGAKMDLHRNPPGLLHISLQKIPELPGFDLAP
jgi:hypothetical protein